MWVKIRPEADSGSVWVEQPVAEYSPKENVSRRPGFTARKGPFFQAQSWEKRSDLFLSGIQMIVTGGVLIWEIKSDHYHGVFCRRINGRIEDYLKSEAGRVHKDNPREFLPKSRTENRFQAMNSESIPQNQAALNSWSEHSANVLGLLSKEYAWRVLNESC